MDEKHDCGGCSDCDDLPSRDLPTGGEIVKHDFMDLTDGEQSELIAMLISSQQQKDDKIRELEGKLMGLSNPPFYIADVLEVTDEYVIIKQHGNNFEFAVKTTDEIKLDLVPGSQVTINSSCAIMGILKSGSDPRVKVMEMISRPDVSYEQIGGLDKQIRDVREVVELPLNKPEVYRKLGIVPPKGVLLYGPPGTGKCLGFDTPIVMFNGSIKMVQDVKENDLLMGPDSKYRRVTGVTRGRGMLYRITSSKGDTFVCNGEHILSLRECGTNKLENISVQEYLKKSNDFKNRHKLWKTGFDLPEKSVVIDPYVVGLWLGDGDYNNPVITHTIQDREIISAMKETAKSLGIRLKYVPDKRHDTGKWKFGNGRTGGKPNPFMVEMSKHCVNGEKRITPDYLYNSKVKRLELLAGIVDTDGHITGNNCIEISTKYKGLAEDINYLASSLGFMVTVRKKKSQIKEIDFEGEYHRIFISGKTNEIPMRIERKRCSARQQIKDVSHFGFSIEEIGDGDYHGFCLDGDGLFILGNFIVTHNTMLAKAVATATNATFIHMASTELVQKFIGEGANLVRDVFQMAREKAPSIIFLDEIDAVATVRVNDGTCGSSEVNRTMMELLSQMEGFEDRGNVRIMGATNRIDILDPAILRPGRFDRLIEIPLPDEKGRLQILKIHTKNMPHVADLVAIAKLTEGFNGAQLRGVSTEAGMFALRREDDVITQADFVEAIKSIAPKKMMESKDERMCW